MNCVSSVFHHYGRVHEGTKEIAGETVTVRVGTCVGVCFVTVSDNVEVFGVPSTPYEKGMQFGAIADKCTRIQMKPREMRLTFSARGAKE